MLRSKAHRIIIIRYIHYFLGRFPFRDTSGYYFFFSLVFLSPVCLLLLLLQSRGLQEQDGLMVKMNKLGTV